MTRPIVRAKLTVTDPEMFGPNFKRKLKRFLREAVFTAIKSIDEAGTPASKCNGPIGITLYASDADIVK